MENIQQAAKPSAMMNEAPMNHLTLSDRLKSYKRTPGSFSCYVARRFIRSRNNRSTCIFNFVYFSKWYPVY